MPVHWIVDTLATVERAAGKKEEDDMADHSLQGDGLTSRQTGII
jgi:hypothetical protein